MTATKIEWADSVWNPVTGCSKISAGCQNCYAERMAKRLAGRCGYPKDDPFRVTTHPERLSEPTKWKRPRRIFVNSMSDLFHPDVPTEFIHDVFHAMGEGDQHTYLILTKRPDRMHKFIQGIEDWDPSDNASNIWLGVSVSIQTEADALIPKLLLIPAAVRFVSVEPMLGPVNLRNIGKYQPLKGTFLERAGGYNPGLQWDEGDYYFNGSKLDWVICGGETGPDARPMHPDWVEDLHKQCHSANVPFFFKSWGEWAEPYAAQLPPEAYTGKEYKDVEPLSRHRYRNSGAPNIQLYRVGKQTAGRLFYGRELNEFPGQVVS